jgi:cystathionine beta-lyase
MSSSPHHDPRFDTPLERRGTGSLKWDRYAGRDILPLWVADMDFAAPACALEALREAVSFGVFGYTRPIAAWAEAFCLHEKRLGGWDVDPSWITWAPGVNVAMNLACRAAAPEGGRVLVPAPVYPPFFSAPEFSGLVTDRVPLAEHPQRGWEFDFDALEAACTPDTRILLLCHPHNPVGRAWTRPELERLAAFALRRRLIVVSDEVHAPLTLVDRPHIPFASLDADIAQRTITLQAPTKTYNQPGLAVAVAVSPDAKLRRAMAHARAGLVAEMSNLGFLAAVASWRHGEPWRLALLDYLRGNRDRLATALPAAIPGVRVCPVEATYLAWVDFRATGIERPAAWCEQRGVGPSDGTDFGAPGWVRLNFGCPRATLDEALRRLGAPQGSAVSPASA